MAGNENGGELLQDAVCRTLAIEMLDGKWPAGESLTLEDVQNRFGISRTVAREVAKTLESMGAVTVRRRRHASPPSTSRRNSPSTRRRCAKSPNQTKRGLSA